MKSNSKQTSASKIVALNVSFKSCLYFEFLLSLSANAHKMLSVEKNIAIRILINTQRKTASKISCFL